MLGTYPVVQNPVTEGLLYLCLHRESPRVPEGLVWWQTL